MSGEMLSRLFLVLTLVEYLLVLPPAWLIFKRAGLRPVLSLVMLIPGFGLWFLLALLAFAEWPSLRCERNS